MTDEGGIIWPHWQSHGSWIVILGYTCIIPLWNKMFWYFLLILLAGKSLMPCSIQIYCAQDILERFMVSWSYAYTYLCLITKPCTTDPDSLPASCMSEPFWVKCLVRTGLCTNLSWFHRCVQPFIELTQLLPLHLAGIPLYPRALLFFSNQQRLNISHFKFYIGLLHCFTSCWTVSLLYSHVELFVRKPVRYISSNLLYLEFI